MNIFYVLWENIFLATWTEKLLHTETSHLNIFLYFPVNLDKEQQWVYPFDRNPITPSKSHRFWTHWFVPTSRSVLQTGVCILWWSQLRILSCLSAPGTRVDPTDHKSGTRDTWAVSQCTPFLQGGTWECSSLVVPTHHSWAW